MIHENHQKLRVCFNFLVFFRGGGLGSSSYKSAGGCESAQITDDTSDENKMANIYLSLGFLNIYIPSCY